MEAIPNAVTKRFIQEVEKLIEAGTAASYAEIANSIEWNKSGMSQVIKGKRNVPIAVYRKFAEEYNVSPTEQTQVNDSTETTYKSAAKLANLNDVDYRDEIIALLKEKNLRLEKGLEANLAALHQDIRVSAGTLTALGKILLLLASEKKVVYKQAVDILRKHEIEGILI